MLLLSRIKRYLSRHLKRQSGEFTINSTTRKRRNDPYLTQIHDTNTSLDAQLGQFGAQPERQAAATANTQAQPTAFDNGEETIRNSDNEPQIEAYWWRNRKNAALPALPHPNNPYQALRDKNNCSSTHSSKTSSTVTLFPVTEPLSNSTSVPAFTPTNHKRHGSQHTSASELLPTGAYTARTVSLTRLTPSSPGVTVVNTGSPGGVGRPGCNSKPKSGLTNVPGTGQRRHSMNVRTRYEMQRIQKRREMQHFSHGVGRKLEAVAAARAVLAEPAVVAARRREAMDERIRAFLGDKAVFMGPGVLSLRALDLPGLEDWKILAWKGVKMDLREAGGMSSGRGRLWKLRDMVGWRNGLEISKSVNRAVVRPDGRVRIDGVAVTGGGDREDWVSSVAVAKAVMKGRVGRAIGNKGEGGSESSRTSRNRLRKRSMPNFEMVEASKRKG